MLGEGKKERRGRRRGGGVQGTGNHRYVQDGGWVALERGQRKYGRVEEPRSRNLLARITRKDTSVHGGRAKPEESTVQLTAQCRTRQRGRVQANSKQRKLKQD